MTTAGIMNSSTEGNAPQQDPFSSLHHWNRGWTYGVTDFAAGIIRYDIG